MWMEIRNSNNAPLVTTVQIWVVYHLTLPMQKASLIDWTRSLKAELSIFCESNDNSNDTVPMYSQRLPS